MTNSKPNSLLNPKTGLLAMVLSPVFAVMPLIAGLALSRVFCGPDANEGNCGWAALPWAMFMTIPLAGLMFIAGLVILIVSLVKKSD
jgi:hypothetical protein